MNKNILGGILDFIKETFEKASPSMLSMLASILPYATPLPIAFLTGTSAMHFLGMTPQVAGIFIFTLEGIGIWTSAILVDSIVQFIRSKNVKSGIMVGMLLIVMAIYLTILINLNVSLEQATKSISPIYSRIITLICFLPTISGFMNGYWKIQLESKTEMEKVKEIEEKHYQEKRQDKKDLKLAKLGIVPNATALNSDTVQVKIKHGSDYKEKVWVLLDEVWNAEKRILAPSEITERINKKYRAELVNGNVKGFWSRTTKDWRSSRGIK